MARTTRTPPQDFLPGLEPPGPPPPTLEEALAEAAARVVKGHPRFYKPLPEAMSALVRAHYAAAVALPPGGLPDTVFRSPKGTVLAVGYRRVVVGDYGAYVEFDPAHMRLDEIVDRFGREPDRPVKYVWMRPRDGSAVKVYRQVGTVAYADYVPGLYYVAPSEVTWA